MAADESPLIKALPPESDYLTYLTIVEYNLTQDNLPILHRVLQDEKLAVNIGWDLVHLLVPYVPDSEQCLQDIACLGNPREVILKVTEGLRLIGYASLEADDAGEDADDSRVRAESSTYPMKTAAIAEGERSPGSSQMVEVPPQLPLPVSQFIALLSMLATLHPRIKTKYPSRFLSTTLQAILASFGSSVTHREEMVHAIVKTVKAIYGIKRPTLPMRKSSSMLSSGPDVSSPTSSTLAADPEAEATSGGEIRLEESAMQTKLLQSFVTHILEEYMLNLVDYGDVPGMAWCSRIMEKLHPERTIPESKRFADRFQHEEKLHRRIETVGQLVTLGQDLRLSDEALLSAAITVEKEVPASATLDEDKPPSSADAIPLSRVGSLLLYTAKQAAAILYDGTSPATAPLAVFPDHQELLKRCLSSPAQGTGTLGTEPEALIDAAVALGLICLEHNAIGEPASDAQFNDYLQLVALLSSNCPSPILRGHAHYLTTTVLRSHPDDNVRLAFIRDTLEQCPFENLKVSAVGWIKGETIEANPPAPVAGHEGHEHAANGHPTSIFATPLALDSLAPFLFPSLHPELITEPLEEAWIAFQTNLSFYLASLNFVYLLLCAKHLHQSLGVADMWKDNDMAGSFLQPLSDAGERFRKELDEGGGLVEERTNGVMAELSLLDETIERVTNAARSLNEA